MAKAVERPNRYFAFLRRLRAEGRSNMYGAVPYLAAAFGIDRNESFRIVCEWIDAQQALAADAAVPRAVVPAERVAAPTFFDPVPGADAVVASRPVPGKAASRKPVKQRRREKMPGQPKSPPPIERRNPPRTAGSSRSKPRATSRRKSPPSSDFRAA